MTIEILSRSLVPTPNTGEATLFLDIHNNNALTAKFSDCCFKVLSAEPYQLTTNQSLLDAQNDILNNLSCSVAKGVISMADYLTLINSFNLYFSSTIDSNGNLNQSITTTAPPPPPAPTPINEDLFDVDNVTFASGLNSYVAGVISITSISSGAPGTANFKISVDKIGGNGAIFASAIAFSTADIVFNGNSYVSDSLGSVTTSPTLTIIPGTSLLECSLEYEGVATAGTYTSVITLIRGTVVRHIPISVTLQP